MNGTSSMPRYSRRQNSVSETRHLIESWQDDLYRDFDNVYSTLCRSNGPANMALGSPPPPPGWSSEATFETRALADSLVNVENALRQATNTPSNQTNNELVERISQLTTPTRADSQNTNQSLATSNGPALVEEMTLSDLEDEICSALMANKDAERQKRFQKKINSMSMAPSSDILHQAGEQLLNGRRSRQPIATGLTQALQSKLTS